MLYIFSPYKAQNHKIPLENHQASTMGNKISQKASNGTTPFYTDKTSVGMQVVSPVLHPEPFNSEQLPNYQGELGVPDGERATVAEQIAEALADEDDLSYCMVHRRRDTCKITGEVSPIFNHAEPINTEQFPTHDGQLVNPDGEQMTNAGDLPHCIVHCRHNACKSQMWYNEKQPGNLPAPVCKCDEKRKQRSPHDRAYKNSTWFLKLRPALVNEIEGVAEDADVTEVVTIYEDESLIILRAISDYQIHESRKFEELTQACSVLPRAQRKNVATIAHNLIHKGLVNYFWNTVARHGEESENTCRKVSLDKLIDELRIYQGVFMADMLCQMRPHTWFKGKWITRSDLTLELQRQRYKDMGPVWEYFDSTVDLLVMVLLWRHKNVHQVAAKL